MKTWRSRAVAGALLATAMGGAAVAGEQPMPPEVVATAPASPVELPPPPEIPAPAPGEPGAPPQLLLAPLDTGEINRVIRSRVAPLRACYDEARLLDPSLGAGVAQIMWRVERGGSVAWAVMKSREFRSPRLAMCLTEVVRGMIFRGSTSGNMIKYPFRFEPPADE